MSVGDVVEHRGFAIRMRAPYEYVVEGLPRPLGQPDHYWTLRGAKQGVAQRVRHEALAALFSLALPLECAGIHAARCARRNLLRNPIRALCR